MFSLLPPRFMVPSDAKFEVGCRSLAPCQQDFYCDRVMGCGSFPRPPVWLPLALDLWHVCPAHNEPCYMPSRAHHAHCCRCDGVGPHSASVTCQCAPCLHIFALLRQCGCLGVGYIPRIPYSSHWSPSHGSHPCSVLDNGVLVRDLALWCASVMVAV
jgi:hypothetical protein